MMGTATGLLIAELSLLTWIATAYAECAWVLWRRSVSMAPATAPRSWSDASSAVRSSLKHSLTS
jgi:hypothetical protein